MAGKKKGKGKRKKKKKGKLPQLPVALLNSRISSLERKLTTKIHLRSELQLQVNIYESLMKKEVLEREECVEILQRAIQKAEIVNDIFKIDLNSFLKQKNKEMQEREDQRKKADAENKKKLGKLEKEKKKLETLLKRLEDFQENREQYESEYAKLEKQLETREEQIMEELQTADETFLTNFVKIGNDLKDQLENTADFVQKDIKSSESWIKKIIDETGRIQKYLQVLERNSSAFLETYPVLKEKVDILRLKIVSPDGRPCIANLLSTVRAQATNLASLNVRYEELLQPLEIVPSLEAEREVTNGVANLLKRKLEDLSKRYDNNQIQYQRLDSEIKDVTGHRIHVDYTKLSQKRRQAHKFISSEVAKTLGQVLDDQEGVVPALLLLLKVDSDDWSGHEVDIYSVGKFQLVPKPEKKI